MPETFEDMTIDQIFDVYAEIVKHGFRPDTIFTTAPEACRLYKSSLNGILEEDELEKIEVTLVPTDEPGKLSFNIGGPPYLVQKVFANTIQPCPLFITEVKE
jgi:hypothetical protein